MHARLEIGAAQQRDDVLLDEIRLAFLDDQHRALACAEFGQLVGDDRVRDVQHVQRHLRFSERVGKSEQLQRAEHAVVHAALQDDPEVAHVGREPLVQPAFADEAQRGGPALRDLLLLVEIARGRQHDAARVAHGVLDGVLQRVGRADVVGGDEAAVDVARADAQFEHHRRVRGLRQFEALFDGPHDRRQVRPRIEQPHLRLHRECVRTLLHDAGAFAVVLADDDQRATRHAAGREVREGIRCDVGPDGRLERDRAAQRCVDRGREGRGGRRLGRAVLEVHAEVLQDVVRVGEHVHEVRDRRALVARDVAHARLQQRLRDGQDAFAAEFLARTEAEFLDFGLERAFGHGVSDSGCAERRGLSHREAGRTAPSAPFGAASMRCVRRWRRGRSVAPRGASTTCRPRRPALG